MNNSFAIVIDCWVFVVIINHSVTNLHDNSWVLIAGEMRLLDMFHSNNLHIFNLWVVNVIVCAKHTDKHIWNVPCTYTLFVTTENVTNSCTNNTNSSKADLKLINNHSLQPQKVSKYLNFPKINLLFLRVVTTSSRRIAKIYAFLAPEIILSIYCICHNIFSLKERNCAELKFTMIIIFFKLLVNKPKRLRWK